MIVFWLLGARMSYQNARVKWSELNLMLPCAISFTFTPESPCALFSSPWQTLKNWTLLLVFHKSWAFIVICFILEEAAKNHLSSLCFILQLIFTFVFFFFFLLLLFQSVFPVKLLLMNLPWNTRSIQRFLFVILQCVQKKKTVPGFDRASAHVCFKTAAHKL